MPFATLAASALAALPRLAADVPFEIVPQGSGMVMRGFPHALTPAVAINLPVGFDMLDSDFPHGGLVEMLDLGPAEQLMRNPFGDLQGGFIEDPVKDVPSLKGVPSILDLLEGHLAHKSHNGDFEISRDGNKMQLVANLTEYKNEPPDVQVVGRSLVVRGHKSSGHMVQSFQRSFQLPKDADTDAIHVEYNKTNGKLSVDVPCKGTISTKGNAAAMTLSSSLEEDSGVHMWQLDPQIDGSQTTITFTSGGAPPNLPLFDPLMNFFLGQAPFDAPFPASAKVEQLPPPLRPPSRARQAPLAVQAKNAKPFWRLVNDHGDTEQPAIEIVAPRGIDLGKPTDRHIPTYNSTDLGLRGKRTALSQLELPVSVGEQDCSWASGPDLTSPWLPMQMLGGTAVAFAVITHLWASRQLSTGKMSRRVRARLLKIVAAICACCLLLGLALSIYMAYHRRSRSYEERVLHCKIGQDSIKTVGVKVTGEL